MALTQQWRDFLAAFNPDTFWYFPHWLVDKPELREILAVFAEFDGQSWNDRKVLKRLQHEELTAGRGAGPRMMRKAMENMALCWLDDRVLRITPAGRQLVDGAEKSTLIERLLWRYRLANPVNPEPNVDVWPHAALIRTMLALDGRVTRDEYLLFAGRLATDDIAPAVDSIRAWRRLPYPRQDEIIDSIERFVELQTAGGYSMGFHRCASYLQAFKDARNRQGLELRPEHLDYVRALLDRHNETAASTIYADIPDWIAAHGDVERVSDLEGAVEYYLDTSQYEKAAETFAKLPAVARGGRTVAEFREAIFLEKDLEDYLVDHLELIEPGLRIVKRQRQIVVGAIDILAKAANGDLVVIELKKVRASDKVFGQLCRYMGCIAAHHATPNQAVRGYIIGSEIDDKLRYAARVVGDTVVKLKRFRRDSTSPDIFVED